MFVRTQFDTIVNLAEFDKVKIEWSVKQSSGSVFHVISAVSDQTIASRGVDDPRKQVSKYAKLAEFSENMDDEAQDAYDDLFTALLNKETAFDISIFKQS